MKRLLAATLFALAGVQFDSTGQERTFDQYCNSSDYEPALRETHIIVDAALITPEDGRPLEENRTWRQALTRLMDVSEQGVLSRWAARERVVVSIAEASGSGLKTVFSGCMPLYSAQEQRELSEKTSGLQTFFGSDWKSELEDDVKAFRRGLTFSLVAGINGVDTTVRGDDFVSSGLSQAIARSYKPTYQYGVPRLIIMTDLAKYDLPKGTIEDNRSAGRDAAAEWAADLGRAEVHLLGASGDFAAPQEEYLKSLFLSAKGDLRTTAGLSGSISATAAPARLEVYQGTVRYPDGNYPFTMRLALDANLRAVNSWVEVQSDQLRFVPFEGALSCQSERNCSFIETGEFAQVWTDAPQGDPECLNWMPFVGFRDMTFSLEVITIEGLISDSACYVPELEDGLPFNLNRRDNAAF